MPIQTGKCFVPGDKVRSYVPTKINKFFLLIFSKFNILFLTLKIGFKSSFQYRTSDSERLDADVISG